MPLGVNDIIAIENQAVDKLCTCYDPEIPVNIYELGLIYQVKADPNGELTARMTLTSPHCPAAASLPQEVHDKLSEIPGVTGVKVELVWDPPWDRAMMSERARLILGFM